MLIRLSSALLAATLWVGILGLPTAHAYPAEVLNASSDAYFDVVMKEIQSAEESIFVTLYLASVYQSEPESKPFQLLKELVAAHERGVDVSVILDQNYNFVDGVPRGDSRGSDRNQVAYEYLKKNNVSVAFDNASQYTHAKVIIIDGDTVILGSANWSKAAFSQNYEANVLIRSPDLAEELLAEFEKIPTVDPAFEHIQKVLIPWEFSNRQDLMGHMVTQQDERSYDIYLYLIKEFDGNSEGLVDLDLDKLAVSIGLGDTTRTSYRRQIFKVLAKLQDEYKLIEYSSEYGKNAKVTLKSLTEKDGIYSVPVEHYTPLPETYWDYGWNRKLLFPGKVMLLLNYSYSVTSKDYPWWHVSRVSLSKWHHIGESFIGDGTQELRKLNLIEVEYKPFEDGSNLPKTSGWYMPNPIYDPLKLEKEWKRLESEYGADAVQRAREYADSVYESNELSAVARLIELENKYGQEVIQKAVGKISEKFIGNPKRNIDYLIGTIQSMGQDA